MAETDNRVRNKEKAEETLEAEAAELAAKADQMEQELAALRGPGSEARRAALWIQLFGLCMSLSNVLAGKLGRPADAVPRLRRALELTPEKINRGNVVILLAKTLQEAGATDEALQRFNEAMALAPKKRFVVYEGNIGAAMCLIALGRAEEAEPHCHRALALKPDDPRSRAALMACLGALEDDEAIERLILASARIGDPTALGLLKQMLAGADTPAEFEAFLLERGIDPAKIRSAKDIKVEEPAS